MKARHVTPAAYRKKAAEDWNTKIRAEHARLRTQILALRPGWSPEKLAAVESTYGTPGKPGLANILDTLSAADALDSRFRTES